VGILIGDVLLADEQIGRLFQFLLKMVVVGGEQGGRFVGLREVRVDFVGAEEGSSDAEGTSSVSHLLLLQ
jgi:hypothetical protein